MRRAPDDPDVPDRRVAGACECQARASPVHEPCSHNAAPSQLRAQPHMLHGAAQGPLDHRRSRQRAGGVPRGDCPDGGGPRPACSAGGQGADRDAGQAARGARALRRPAHRDMGEPHWCPQRRGRCDIQRRHETCSGTSSAWSACLRPAVCRAAGHARGHCSADAEAQCDAAGGRACPAGGAAAVRGGEPAAHAAPAARAHARAGPRARPQNPDVGHPCSDAGAHAAPRCATPGGAAEPGRGWRESARTGLARAQGVAGQLVACSEDCKAPVLACPGLAPFVVEALRVLAEPCARLPECSQGASEAIACLVARLRRVVSISSACGACSHLLEASTFSGSRASTGVRRLPLGRCEL